MLRLSTRYPAVQVPRESHQATFTEKLAELVTAHDMQISSAMTQLRELRAERESLLQEITTLRVASAQRDGETMSSTPVKILQEHVWGLSASCPGGFQEPVAREEDSARSPMWLPGQAVQDGDEQTRGVDRFESPNSSPSHKHDQNRRGSQDTQASHISSASPKSRRSWLPFTGHSQATLETKISNPNEDDEDRMRNSICHVISQSSMTQSSISQGSRTSHKSGGLQVPLPSVEGQVTNSSEDPFMDGEQRTQVHDRFCWQWEHRSGWKDYTMLGQHRIERAFQKGENKVRLQAGKVGATPMEIFFVDMIQFDPVTENRRRVRRTGPLPITMKCRRVLLEAYRAWLTSKPWRESADHYQERRRDLIQRLNTRQRSQRYQEGFSYSENVAARIVQSSWFNACTMILVLSNAIWIAVETDLNDEAVLSDASHLVQAMEHGFCFAFSLELVVRFIAFKKKTNCLFDSWFRFDLAIVVFMVVETWLVPLLFWVQTDKEQSGAGSNFGILRMARLLRLSRIARLLRAAPEIVILIKGIATAFRSVMAVFMLLSCLLYVFGVMLRAQAKAFPVLADLYFDSIWKSMWTLFVHGTLLDNVMLPLNVIKEHSVDMTILFCLFLFLSNLVALNMLIGILCDVVSRVKTIETDRVDRQWLRHALSEMLECYDFNHDGMLEESELRLLMENPEVAEILGKFGTDVADLLIVTNIVFADSTEMSQEGHLSFDEFMELVSRLKATHTVQVADVVEQRSYTRQCIERMEQHVKPSLAVIMEDLGAIRQQTANKALGAGPEAPDVVFHGLATGLDERTGATGSAADNCVLEASRSTSQMSQNSQQSPSL